VSELLAKKAVILLSGGLDSATVLAIAKSMGFDCYCLSFEYGQKHDTEVRYAEALATTLGAVEHRVASIDIGAFGGSALTDATIEIPVTYVPARNTVFLSYALGWAEVLGAQDIFLGVNAVDYSGYPDCRPEFIHAFETMANLATKTGVQGLKLSIRAPLIDLTKGEIITLGVSLGVDYQKTVSCYRLTPEGLACGECDSCVLRATGFADAGMEDPTVYW
jgi:7-cyano-7-deazaguanine synthase